MIRILIVDDHQLVRQGIRALVNKAKDIQIVGEARDGIEALEIESSTSPDVILMDIEMPHMDGLKATMEIVQRQSVAKVLILSMRSDEETVRQAAQSGARGYLIKDTNRDELIAAIRAVHRGETFCSKELADNFRF